MGHHSSMSQSTANTGQLPSNGPVTGQRRRGSRACLCSCMIICDILQIETHFRISKVKDKTNLGLLETYFYDTFI